MKMSQQYNVVCTEFYEALVSNTNKGHEESHYPDPAEAVQGYFVKMKDQKIHDAIKILEDLRTEVIALLGDRSRNCVIEIFVDAKVDYLRSVIGEGSHTLVINIMGEEMKWIYENQTTAKEKNYACIIGRPIC